MIKGVHTMFYSSDAKGLRSFIRDKLGFSATDVGEFRIQLYEPHYAK